MNTPSAKKKIDRRLESVLAGIESEMIALVAGIAAEHKRKRPRPARQSRREPARAA
jgi:hypothetical protein